MPAINRSRPSRCFDVNGIGFVWFFLILVLAGCHQQTPEQRAQQDAQQGRYQSAITHYEESFAQGDHVRIHLKMADLFTAKLHDPASAVYHYRRVLALRPSGREADWARNQIKVLANGTSSGNGTAPARSVAPKASLAALAAAEAERQAKARVRTYVVQSGDTLVSISRKFYQTPNRWKDILDTNKYQVTNPDELKAGQTIILP
jgi:LysM repeat protein